MKPPEALARDLARAGLAGRLLVHRDIPAAPPLPGAYALLIRLDAGLRLERPRDAQVMLQPGCYVYAGSARGPGGIAARLARHFRRPKPVHWHVDQITARASCMAALALPGQEECAIIERLTGTGRFRTACDRFGSTDCRRCRSHLLAWTPRGAGPA